MSNESRIESFSNRLKTALTIRDITAAELAVKTGLSKAQLSQYTNGVYEAKQKALYKLAQALNVNEAWLMGYDVPMEKGENLLETWEEKYNPDGALAEQVKIEELIRKEYGDDCMDAVTLYNQLDSSDKGEIRGEMKHMLKADKYSVKKESKNA